jgi:hypothetical protein
MYEFRFYVFKGRFDCLKKGKEVYLRKRKSMIFYHVFLQKKQIVLFGKKVRKTEKSDEERQ